jgi:formylglycine-generating enzyme required for sulfatase activity
MRRMKGNLIYLLRGLLVFFVILPCCPVQAARPVEKAEPEEPDKWKTRTITLPGSEVEMELVYIPPGTFMMGSTPEEVQDAVEQGVENKHVQHEMPRHQVTIEKGFWMGRTEVTNEQYRTFKPDHDSGTAWGFGLNADDQPAVYIRWREAERFCNWLRKRSGKPFDLPSEAQWEYACRAGTTTKRFWGDGVEEACEYANVFGPVAKKELDFPWQGFECEDGYTVASPVASFKPNPFGLYDMLGNVWEWCKDGYYDGYEAAPADGSAWTEPASSYRIFRGGGWLFRPAYIRCAVRAKNFLIVPYDFIGLRVVLNEELEEGH